MSEKESYAPRVYVPEEVGAILNLKRSATYSFLSEAYKKQPFKVYRIGSQYRVVKDSFDSWLNGL